MAGAARPLAGFVAVVDDTIRIVKTILSSVVDHFLDGLRKAGLEIAQS